MTTALVVVLVVAAAAFVWRERLRRWRTVRRLKRAELEVADALADGRLAQVTGESLLQHFEGLRRALAGGRGS